MTDQQKTPFRLREHLSYRQNCTSVLQVWFCKPEREEQAMYKTPTDVVEN